uniref:Uncharacterized protein n=1 Tax=Aegilops tauschii TaxID=37682 RepID=M8BBD7_AEGTA
MEHGFVDSLVARSLVLEVLNIVGYIKCGLRLRLVSQSLRCIQICGSVLENIAVVKAPCLERLILSSPYMPNRGLCARLRIVDAPKLHTFGYLEPGQVLEVHGTVIMPGIKPSENAMLTGVKILSMEVRFGVRNDVKMVPTFLKCFPNAERLHIVSKKCDEPTGEPLTVKFWEESGPIENVVSRINLMTFREFKGDRGEVGFLEFVFKSARALEMVAIFMANPSFTPFSMDEALVKAQYSAGNLASKSCKKCIIWSSRPEGGDPWSLRVGADFSFEDPFTCCTCDGLLSNLWLGAFLVEGLNVESITVLKAPQLERLILQLPGKTIRGLIWILDAPKLCVFGLPQNHVLEIRDTIIMSGMKASLSTIVTSVILSLKVCFGVRDEAEMVPVFLKCFPNVERLHITVFPQMLTLICLLYGIW